MSALFFRLRNTIAYRLYLNPWIRKLLGIRHIHLFNSLLTRTIITHYDGDSGHQTDITTGSLGYGFLHYALILNLKPKRVLCIGSRKGFIPAICALACAENGVGRVDFVDAGYGGSDEHHWSGIGWWKRIDPRQHFSVLGASTRLTTHIMTTQTFVRKYRHTYDYIYIDGDHSYDGAKKDWKLLWPRLKKGGVMVFHDVVVRHTKDLGAFGVWKLWKELDPKHSLIFPFPKESGLGIIQKQ